MLISGHTLLNAIFGIAQYAHWEAPVWVRNLLNRDYLQNVTVQAGNSDLIVGTRSDLRFVGATVRILF